MTTHHGSRLSVLWATFVDSQLNRRSSRRHTRRLPRIRQAKLISLCGPRARDRQSPAVCELPSPPSIRISRSMSKLWTPSLTLRYRVRESARFCSHRSRLWLSFWQPSVSTVSCRTLLVNGHEKSESAWRLEHGSKKY